MFAQLFDQYHVAYSPADDVVNINYKFPKNNCWVSPHVSWEQFESSEIEYLCVCCLIYIWTCNSEQTAAWRARTTDHTWTWRDRHAHFTLAHSEVVYTDVGSTDARTRNFCNFCFAEDLNSTKPHRWGFPMFSNPQGALAVLANIQEQHPGDVPVREAHRWDAFCNLLIPVCDYIRGKQLLQYFHFFLCVRTSQFKKSLIVKVPVLPPRSKVIGVYLICNFYFHFSFFLLNFPDGFSHFSSVFTIKNVFSCTFHSCQWKFWHF